jgi:hypothetical protein
MMAFPVGAPISPLNRPIYLERRLDTTGAGVQPDLPSPADQALKAAHIAALEKLRAKYPDRSDSLESENARLRAN